MTIAVSFFTWHTACAILLSPWLFVWQEVILKNIGNDTHAHFDTGPGPNLP